MLQKAQYKDILSLYCAFIHVIIIIHDKQFYQTYNSFIVNHLMYTM